MTNTEKRKFKKSDIATLKWMWGTFHKERWQVFVLIVANVVNAVVTVMYAGFSQKVIDAAATEKSIKRVVYYSVCFFRYSYSICYF